jgi:hypothetical protein
VPMDLPIICTLSEPELQQRRREVLDVVKTAAIKTTELPNGYAYQFPPDSELITMLARLVAKPIATRMLKFAVFLLT